MCNGGSFEKENFEVKTLYLSAFSIKFAEYVAQILTYKI